MEARIRDRTAKPRFVIAVSQGSHCLNDLLHRWSTGNLAIDVVGVVSNHEAQRRLSEWHGVPFHYLPVSEANRADQEAAILDVMARGGAEYLVLARYMQVLSSDLSAKLARSEERRVGKEGVNTFITRWCRSRDNKKRQKSY